MDRSLPLTFLATLLLCGAADAQCRLCAPASTATARAPATPLRVEAEATLDLGRAAQGRSEGGTIALDERSGARVVSGGLVDLGGFALKGTVRLSGEPFAPVAVMLPPGIRLTAPDGGTADITELRTDLPPDPALDAQGRLAFNFGGRLIVPGGASGDFRGRIPVVAEYR